MSFDAQLSVSRNLKVYRLTADALIIVYSTFTLLPANAPRKIRLLVLLLMLAVFGCQVSLYEVYPELDPLRQLLQREVLANSFFARWATFNFCELLGYLMSAVMAALAAFFRLNALSESTLAADIRELSEEKNDGRFKARLAAISSEYSGLAETLSQKQRFSKLFGLVLMGVSSLSFYEKYWRQAGAEQEA